MNRVRQVVNFVLFIYKNGENGKYFAVDEKKVCVG